MKHPYARLCLLLLGVLACSAESEPASREPAPPLQATSLDGTPLTLADLAGKTVLVDFWATWCPPCVIEIPELNAVWEQYRGRDFTILAISIDTDPPQQIADWVKEKGVSYPVALADLDVAAAYGAHEFPYHLLLGPDGTVLERLAPGYHDRAELSEVIERHLGS